MCEIVEPILTTVNPDISQLQISVSTFGACRGAAIKLSLQPPTQMVSTRSGLRWQLQAFLWLPMVVSLCLTHLPWLPMVVSLCLTHLLLEVASPIIFLPSPLRCHSSSRSKGLHWWRRSKAYKLHIGAMSRCDKEELSKLKVDHDELEAHVRRPQGDEYSPYTINERTQGESLPQ